MLEINQPIQNSYISSTSTRTKTSFFADSKSDELNDLDSSNIFSPGDSIVQEQISSS